MCFVEAEAYVAKRCLQASAIPYGFTLFWLLTHKCVHFTQIYFAMKASKKPGQAFFCLPVCHTLVSNEDVRPKARHAIHGREACDKPKGRLYWKLVQPLKLTRISSLRGTNFKLLRNLKSSEKDGCIKTL